jgi:large subunit ribosomal protein L25
MDELVLNAVPRTVTGSADCRRLRRDGLVPCVIYGHGEHQNVTINLHDFILLLHQMHSEHAVVVLELDGKKQNVLIKDVQRHDVTHTISHIDFLVVDLDETVRITIPVEIMGEADGVKNFGGVLELIQREVEIECKAKDIPEAVVADVSPLKVHDVIRIGELPAIDGVTFTGDPETTVITIAPPTVHAEVVPHAEEEEVEEAAEPEVITAKTTEEAGEEG